METPISKEMFTSIKKSLVKLIDSKGKPWIFADDPKPESSKLPITRLVVNPNGKLEKLTYTDEFGQNNIIDEEDAIVVELNNPNTRIV